MPLCLQLAEAKCNRYSSYSPIYPVCSWLKPNAIDMVLIPISIPGCFSYIPISIPGCFSCREPNIPTKYLVFLNLSFSNTLVFLKNILYFCLVCFKNITNEKTIHGKIKGLERFEIPQTIDRKGSQTGGKILGNQ